MRAFRATLVLGAAMALAFASAAPASADPAPGSGTVSPQHTIACAVTPYIPAKVPLGVQYGGRVNCSEPLDIRVSQFILWRCWGSTCVREGTLIHNSTTPANLERVALGPCRAGTYRYHTQVIVEGFHHAWRTYNFDSNYRNYTC